jgi:uncharacterized protein (DUF1810 family)
MSSLYPTSIADAEIDQLTDFLVIGPLVLGESNLLRRRLFSEPDITQQDQLAERILSDLHILERVLLHHSSQLEHRSSRVHAFARKIRDDVERFRAFHLNRFLEAQQPVYEKALEEIRAGKKEMHWMWFVFPQLAGLGSSANAIRFGIQTIEEARAYLDHPVLGERLRECCIAVLEITGKTAKDIFDSPDDLKLRSSATLFAQVSSPGSVFHRILDQYYGGQGDPRTLALLNERAT